MKKFIYDGIVTGDDFCPRIQDTDKLLSYINDSTNVLLIAKRRMGKSSLIHEVFENRLDKKKFITIYVDIFDITDETDFVKSLYRAVGQSLKLDFKLVLQTLKTFFNKSTFEISIGQDGTPSINPKLATRDIDELFADIFNGLHEYLKRHNLKAAFCIDEFQQIQTIKKPLDATLRKYIQKHHNISYIFTGSKRHTLAKLFQGQKSPLMGMVTPMELGPINQDDFYKFAKKRLKTLTKDTFINLYNHAEGESKLVQHLCRQLKLMSDDNQPLDEALAIKGVISEVDSICRNIFESLSPNGRKIIKMITEKSHTLLTKEILQEHNISKSSAQTSIDYLIKEDLIFKEDSNYFLDGGIGSSFSLWCHWKFKGY